MHNPSNCADDSRTNAYRNLSAHAEGWPDADTRAAAHLGMRMLAVRVIEWRENVNQPCVDAEEVMAWVEDRVRHGKLAFPDSAMAVTDPVRYVALRRACRCEWDLHLVRQARERMERFYEAEGASAASLDDDVSWTEPAEPEPPRMLNDAERAELRAAPQGAGWRETFARVCLAAAERLRRVA